TEYSEKGLPKSKGHYKAGKEDGEWQYWFENGNEKTRGRFRDGRQVGEWRYWSEDGREVGKLNYPEG
ncbi:MAG TPA: hypothetical protein VGE52_15890, partial [Pirellulales bacterium]